MATWAARLCPCSRSPTARPQGSAVELYCHDNEHQRQLEQHGGLSSENDSTAGGATQTPFAKLASLMEKQPLGRFTSMHRPSRYTPTPGYVEAMRRLV